MLCDLESEFNAESNYLFVHSLVMAPKELLRLLMVRDGLNTHSLGAVKGMPGQPQIHKFLHDGVKEPRRSTMKPLAEHFKVSLDAFYDPEVADLVARELRLGPYSGDAQPAQAELPAIAPASASKGAHLKAPDSLEKEILAELQHLTRRDKEKLLKTVRELAADRRELREEMLEDSGLTGIQERAAAASRGISSATSVAVHRKPSTPRATAPVDPTPHLPGFEDE